MLFYRFRCQLGFQLGLNLASKTGQNPKNWFSHTNEFEIGAGNGNLVSLKSSKSFVTQVIPPSTSIISSLNQSWPQRFCGIKDSSGDLSYCKLLAKNKDFRVFPSSEVSISEAFLSNFSGCISATANQTSPLCATAWQNKQNEQTELIDKIKVIRDGIASEALVPSIKFLIGKRTGEKSWSNVVPPLHKISKRRMGELENLEKVYLKLFS